MNVPQLILDFVYVCEKRGEMLDFEEFIPLWTEANALTEETFKTTSLTQSNE